MKFVSIVVLSLLCFSVCGAETKVFYADGPAGSKKIALSFDDGPGVTSEKILEILKEKNVKATFFMLGTQVVKNPKTARKIKEAGHEVASHTYGHFNFYVYNEEDKNEKIESELLKSEKEIEKTTGVKPFLVRFPYGYSKKDARDAAKKNGYYVINWSFGCDWDTKLSDEEMYEKYAGALKNGAIFLMHDSNTKAVNILAAFIDFAKESGYEIVTAGELLDLKKPAKQAQK